MPHTKSWSDNIVLIFQHLEHNTQAVYTRSEVATLFKIGRSQATDLMRIAGAEIRNGAPATVSRSNLLLYLERCPEAQGWHDEQVRQAKLAQKLREASAAARLGLQMAGRLNPFDQYVRFQDLVDVSLEPGRLTIVFDGPVDLAYKLYQLALAQANEPDVFQRMCGHRAPPLTAAMPSAATVKASSLNVPSSQAANSIIGIPGAF